jgi:bifunctional DNA-binding transcriptional regulator/antitoxin component of YhaV-PrlF toxin-antitoxin module
LSIVELDSKGRLTLPKEVRTSLGMSGKVLTINAGDHVKVIPLPSDPVRSLNGVLDIKKPFKELRRGAEAAAEKEAKRQS